MEKNTTTYQAVEKMNEDEYAEMIVALAMEEINGQCDGIDQDIIEYVQSEGVTKSTIEDYLIARLDDLNHYERLLVEWKKLPETDSETLTNVVFDIRCKILEIIYNWTDEELEKWESEFEGEEEDEE